ncbi:acyltransferase family protein [Yinghuangia soli]|uniref:Acyltransferase n=1 Tax=Yinghuangia soli TaxID=2908204 RepID=A0AA41Q1N7_9ACTN|nr:acyltransferase [Yinghuangia soli]MCF2529552.1 acyltransferase [Yinghuangia soli]
MNFSLLSREARLKSPGSRQISPPPAAPADAPAPAEASAPETPKSPTAPAAPRAAGGRLAALDGLRFIAAAIVMLHHFVIAPYAWGIGEPQRLFDSTLVVVSGYGWLGVEFFFLISGFVICMSSWGRSIGQFVTSRITRLYPAYWAAIVVTTLIVYTVAEGKGVSAVSVWDRLLNLTMLQEPLGAPAVDAVYWTLWVELRFYLLFAIVVWRGVTYQRVIVFCALWMTAATLATAIDNRTLEILLIPESAPFFIAGIAFFLMRRNGPTLLLWGIVAFAFAFSQHSVIARQESTEWMMHHNMPSWPTHALVTLFYVVMAVLALGYLDRIRYPWLTTLGALTFPVYLIHCEAGWALIIALRGRFNPHLVVFMVMLWVLVVAWLIHVLVEKRVAPRLSTGLKRAFATMPKD